MEVWHLVVEDKSYSLKKQLSILESWKVANNL